MERFKTPKRVLLYDRMANLLIKAGGIGIIAVVLGIFLFILGQVLPLFYKAKVTSFLTAQLPVQNYQALGMDESGDYPFLFNENGEISFIDLKNGSIQSLALPFHENPILTSFDYNPDWQSAIYGTQDGRFALIKINFETTHAESLSKTVPQLEAGDFNVLSSEGWSVEKITFGGNDKQELVAGLLHAGSSKILRSVVLKRSENLMGESSVEMGDVLELNRYIPGQISDFIINENGNALLVTTTEGRLVYFRQEESGLKRIQILQPFKDSPQNKIQNIDFIFGGESIVVSNPTGEAAFYSLLVPEGQNQRIFVETKARSQYPSASHYFSKSLRNKSYLAGAENWASLRYATTQDTRWEKFLPFRAKLGQISKKNNRIAFLDSEQRLHLYKLNDPHPEGSWQTFFGKIWYEGASKPSYTWQSSGGSDSFEPKLSLIPLIFGTLKGTFYALLFSIPVALLAAIYTSQFLHPKFRKIVKPTLEMMASLPSVILGFIAALWLAPLIEDKIPSFLLVSIGIPFASLIFGWLWNRFPLEWREKVGDGQEWLLLVPILLITGVLLWSLGPSLERLLFTVVDPSTGKKIADFRLWWPEFTGTSFNQRNSLIVGFMMGFAVIPLIFTIADDALAAVPKSLTSASLALGASRWQTSFHVVLPAAVAGIFSAIMIGFGRAVGETMIVLMATGNTPILDWNIFSGMRTLSANLAVELPEAPVHSTLYRTLFLGALLLFLMTFLLNSLAELLRQRIRKKFKAL